MNSIYTDRESRPQNDRDRYSVEKLINNEVNYIIDKRWERSVKSMDLNMRTKKSMIGNKIKLFSIKKSSPILNTITRGLESGINRIRKSLIISQRSDIEHLLKERLNILVVNAQNVVSTTKEFYNFITKINQRKVRCDKQVGNSLKMVKLNYYVQTVTSLCITKSQKQLIERCEVNNFTPDIVARLYVRKEEKNMTKRMSAENHAPYTPTFYGVDRKERLERYLTEVSDDSLPFSEVVNGRAEVDESEGDWRRRNGGRE